MNKIIDVFFTPMSLTDLRSALLNWLLVYNVFIPYVNYRITYEASKS